MLPLPSSLCPIELLASNISKCLSIHVHSAGMPGLPWKLIRESSTGLWKEPHHSRNLSRSNRSVVQDAKSQRNFILCKSFMSVFSGHRTENTVPTCINPRSLTWFTWKWWFPRGTCFSRPLYALLFSFHVKFRGLIHGPQNAPRKTKVLSRRKAKLDTQPSRPSGHSATSSCEDNGTKTQGYIKIPTKQLGFEV